MNTKVGFTGTRQGLSEIQEVELRKMLDWLRPVEFHHGDCVGADADAQKILRSRCPYSIVVVHPPKDLKARAFCPGHRVLKSKTYIERNHDIVDDTDVLIAAPLTDQEQVRSGTWATVRYAKRMGKQVIILGREFESEAP